MPVPVLTLHRKKRSLFKSEEKKKVPHGEWNEINRVFFFFVGALTGCTQQEEEEAVLQLEQKKKRKLTDVEKMKERARWFRSFIHIKISETEVYIQLSHSYIENAKKI